MENNYLGKAVIIEWLDSVSLHGWRQVSGYQDVTCRDIVTLGTVIKETDKEIMVAGSYIRGTEHCDAQADGVVIIPKCSIESIGHL